MIWLRHILQDLKLLTSEPTQVYNDNQAADDWSKTFSMKGLRHYNIRENMVREQVQDGAVVVSHVDGKCNPSDLLTKEHKSDAIFREIRDSFMSPRTAGGCHSDQRASARIST